MGSRLMRVQSFGWGFSLGVGVRGQGVRGLYTFAHGVCAQLQPRCLECPCAL